MTQYTDWYIKPNIYGFDHGKQATMEDSDHTLSTKINQASAPSVHLGVTVGPGHPCLLLLGYKPEAEAGFGGARGLDCGCSHMAPPFLWSACLQTHCKPRLPVKAVATMRMPTASSSSRRLTAVTEPPPHLGHHPPCRPLAGTGPISQSHDNAKCQVHVEWERAEPA